ncbi:hypothetical protein ACHAXT_004659 [Thalassiosira profunda]
MHRAIVAFLPLAHSLAATRPTVPVRRLAHGGANAQSTSPSARTSLDAYGKGSEIWPECNEEPILLSASFPGGVIPQPAQALLDSDASTDATPSAALDTSAVDALSASSTLPASGRKRRAVRMTLSHLLQSAARASTRRAKSTDMENDYQQTHRQGTRTNRAGDIGHSMRRYQALIAMSLYLIGLASWCAAPKVGSTDHRPLVNMPSLPEKGHVPHLITNPLGASLTNSRTYRTWLRLGALLGILLPTVTLVQLTLGNANPAIMDLLEWMNVGNVAEAKRLVGGPMFLLCCQALTEAVARAALLPLPIRILIPVLFNSVRLPSLQSWAFPSAGTIIPTSLRALGVANLLYWYANLFLFLIPVGVVRYLRAHFFSVEAAEVTLNIQASLNIQ